MTKVIFRVDERDHQKEVIAVLPDQAGDMNPERTCAAYIHTGQHVAISADYTEWTRPATPDEYKDILSELVSFGYDDLQIYQKSSYADFLSRKEQTRRG